MIRTSSALDAAIRGDGRKFETLVTVDFASLRFDSALAVRAENATSGSIPDQIADGFAFYYPNRFFLGRPLPARLFPSVPNIHAGAGYQPRRALQKTHVGYIGPLAGPDGSIEDLVGIRFSPRTIRGFKIVTDPSRIIRDATLTVYADDRSVLAERGIENNESSEILLSFSAVETARRSAYVELEIHRGTPNLRPWILQFSPSLTRTFSADDLISWKIETKRSETKEAAVGRVLIRSLALTLFNSRREFDFYNPDSELYGALQPGLPVEVRLSLAGEDLFASTFYAQSIEAAEDEADVKIKALDLIGFRKDRPIDAAIAESVSAVDAFIFLASRIGLGVESIDERLRSVVLPFFSFSGTVGACLNELCVLTGALCYVSADGLKLVVLRAESMRGRSRYPRRWFSSDEYGKTSVESQDKIPTVVTVQYTALSFDQGDSVSSTFTRRYVDIPVQAYPPEQTVIPTYDRSPGAGLPPGWVFTFEKPANYLRVDFSDSYAWESLEYEAVDNGDGTVTIRVWNFGNTSLDEQLTVAVMARDNAKVIKLMDEDQLVPSRPAEYVAQLESDDIVIRNSPNAPYEFTVELVDKIAITSIVPGNRQKPGQFEYVVEPNSYGCLVRVWNYLATEQTFSVAVYGRRLVESDSAKTMRFRDEEGVRERGEIVKDLSLSGIPSVALAAEIARSSAAYYRAFLSRQTVTPWADPRMEVGDHVAVESMRGYGWVHGIIDEHTLEFASGVSQSYKVLEVRRHNRDCRVVGGATVGDRPGVALEQGDPV